MQMKLPTIRLLSVFNEQNRTILLVALFIMVTGNYSLFKNILSVYPLVPGNLPFLFSLTAFFSLFTVIWLLLICHGRATRWVLALYLLAASQAGYYMDQYGVVLDKVMIDNIFHTNFQEAAGLMSFELLMRTILFGALPVWWLFRKTPQQLSLRAEWSAKLALLVMLLAALLSVVAPFTSGYASFLREHKVVRTYSNPLYFTYSLIGYLRSQWKTQDDGVLHATTPDATEIGPKEKNELIILVVGEAARADRFSLNGYARETNPELARQGVVSFRNVSSCGTSTGVSVPCMFSVLTREEFDADKAAHMENVLDVLYRIGVRILWRDNNSDSKGVATRMRYENYRVSPPNKVCNPECRDEGMLEGLDKFVAETRNEDILIVLHQMGNHGPEYYKRYPKNFERYQPVCASSELRDCGKEQIDNAYDNAILYTDHFLARVIEFLKKYDGDYETAMLYVSDHGESLGEHNLYLHGAPYLIAPEAQTHIPAVLWMGRHFDYSIDQMRRYRDQPLSQNDLFCLMLGAFEVTSEHCKNYRPLIADMIKSGH